MVYVDNDPIVLRHAQALLGGSPQGATDYLQADLREPGPILDRAAGVLDFGQPVAVMLLGVLHLIADDEDPWDASYAITLPMIAKPRRLPAAPIKDQPITYGNRYYGGPGVTSGHLWTCCA